MAETAKLKLSKTTVEAIKLPHEGESIVWDRELHGFGVRASSTGRRTYFIYGRTKAGRQVKLKVGVHGAITATKARELAQIELGKLAAGDDPSQERRDAKEAEKKRREAPTMRELAAEYLSDHAEVKKRTAEADRETLEKIILPSFGAKRVAELTHQDIDRLHRKMSDRPYRANRTLALISKMMNLAVQWKYRLDNPARGIERYQEHRRERYLLPHEIARLGDALAKHSNKQSANAVRLLLLTGARRGEVLGATWDQFDLDAGTWTKPGAHTKQKTTHRVPLSPAAIELLRELDAAAEERAKKARERRALFKRSPYVFPGETADSHQGDLKHFWASICKSAEIKGARLHDLRHTYASLLASSGLSLPIIGALLGHTQAATTHRYAHLMDDPLRQATTAVAVKLEEIARAPRKGKLVAAEP